MYKSYIFCIEGQCAHAGVCYRLFLVAEEVAINESKLKAVLRKKQASSAGK